jgi:hypothetical protein
LVLYAEPAGLWAPEAATKLDEEPAVDIEGIVAEAVLALLKARGSHRLDQYQACCGQGMVCGGRNASEADKWPATLCARKRPEHLQQLLLTD